MWGGLGGSLILFFLYQIEKPTVEVVATAVEQDRTFACMTADLKLR